MRKNKNFRRDPNLNPYKVKQSTPPSSKTFIDFNIQRVCPSCGKAIKISYNFCKFCGVDLSAIEPIGNSDEISKQLAITAAIDPDPGVRKEAADELGDLHHPYSMEVLSKALKDESPIVRKEAIEGLKKIKRKTKPEKFDRGKPKERVDHED